MVFVPGEFVFMLMKACSIFVVYYNADFLGLYSLFLLYPLITAAFRKGAAGYFCASSVASSISSAFPAATPAAELEGMPIVMEQPSSAEVIWSSRKRQTMINKIRVPLRRKFIACTPSRVWNLARLCVVGQCLLGKRALSCSIKCSESR